MQIFVTALEAVLPLVLLILLGCLLRAKGFLTDDFLSVGSKVVFRLCLPVMLFVSVYSIENLSQVRWDLCLYCVGALVLIFLLGIVTAIVTTPVVERRGVLVQCIFRSNFAIVGMPLAATLGGEESAAVAAILVAVMAPLFNVLAVLALAMFRKDEEGRVNGKEIVWDVVRNPLIIGVAAGLLALLVRQWQIGQFGAVVFSLERDLAAVYDALRDLKSMTTPLALIVLGGQFRFSAVRGLFKEILTGTVWRTVLAPIIGVGGAILLSRWGVLHCGAAEYPALIALFGSPVAVSSAIMAREMRNDEQLATQLLVWTSVVSIVTIFAAVCLMMSVGLIAV